MVNVIDLAVSFSETGLAALNSQIDNEAELAAQHPHADILIDLEMFAIPVAAEVMCIDREVEGHNILDLGEPNLVGLNTKTRKVLMGCALFLEGMFQPPTVHKDWPHRWLAFSHDPSDVTKYHQGYVLPSEEGIIFASLAHLLRQ